MIKNSVQYFCAPIKSLNDNNKKVYLWFSILLIIVMAVAVSVLNCQITMTNSKDLESILEAGVTRDRLNVVLIIISILFSAGGALLGYLLLACVFKIIFIFMKKEVGFNKVVYNCYYMACIAMAMSMVNAIISYFVGTKQISVYTDFSCLVEKGTYLSSILQVIDPFVIAQFVFLYLFVSKVVKMSRKQSAVFTTVYILIVTLQIMMSGMLK